MKTPNLGNYSVLDPDKHFAISQMYASGKYTTARIAQIYGVSTRQIQRIATKYGIIRTNAEGNRVAAPLKNYHRLPPEMRVKRTQLKNAWRLETILNHPFCTYCGARVEDGIRLEVDHIDNNPTNNAQENLQVLCGPCNRGKYHLSRGYSDRG
jgi:5-methylcytosine-specific restriction endonuclease McrA